MQPVITIFNKPVSDNSGVFESNKHILSEGRADLIGKRFTFENGNIRRNPDEVAFHSVKAEGKPLFQMILEEQRKDMELEVQKRKFSNHLEYSMSNRLAFEIQAPSNADPTKGSSSSGALKIEVGSPCQGAYAMEQIQNKPTEDDIGTVKLRISE